MAKGFSKVIDFATRQAISEVGEASTKSASRSAKKIIKPNKAGAKRTYEQAYRRLELEDTFDNAVKVGNKKNHVYVDKESPILGSFIDNIRKDSSSEKNALNKAIKDNTTQPRKVEPVASNPSPSKKDLKGSYMGDTIADESPRVKSKSDMEAQVNRYKDNGVVFKGTRPKLETNTSKLKGTMYDSQDNYMKYRRAVDYDEAMKDFADGKKDNSIIKQLSGDVKEGSTLKLRDIEAARTEAIRTASKSDMGLIDTMGYHKIPQKATGVVGTMWLVNQMAASNGQQSNAQLYNQQ